MLVGCQRARTRHAYRMEKDVRKWKEINKFFFMKKVSKCFCDDGWRDGTGIDGH